MRAGNGAGAGKQEQKQSEGTELLGRTLVAARAR